MLLMQDDLASCWEALGDELGATTGWLLENRTLHTSKEQALYVLIMWRDKKGDRATVGRLVDALNAIGEKRIAEKLLGAYVNNFVQAPVC